MAQGSIHDLEILASVMRTGGFSEAARELGLTQPSVSQAVGRIERRFDTTLVTRGRKEGQPALTQTGRALEPHLNRIMRELADATDKIDSIEGRRPIRVGLPPIISRHFFGDEFDPIRKACEGRTVELCSYGSERMLHEFARHNIDVGMVASADPSPSIPGVRLSKVASFPLCVAMRPDDATRMRLVSPDQLQGWTLVSFTGDFAQRDALARLFKARGNMLHISIETDQPDLMRRLVVAGMGVGIATRIAFDGADDIAVLPILGEGVPCFNVFVFDDVSRPVRPESEQILAVKRLLFDAASAAR